MLPSIMVSLIAGETPALSTSASWKRRRFARVGATREKIASEEWGKGGHATRHMTTLLA